MLDYSENIGREEIGLVTSPFISKPFTVDEESYLTQHHPWCVRYHPLYGNIICISAQQYNKGPFTYKEIGPILLWPQYHWLFSCQFGRNIKCVVWHGHTFRITGPLCRESTSCQWILSMKPVMQSFDFITRRNKRKLLQTVEWQMKWDASSTIKYGPPYNTFNFLYNTHNREHSAVPL